MSNTNGSTNPNVPKAPARRKRQAPAPIAPSTSPAATPVAAVQKEGTSFVRLGRCTDKFGERHGSTVYAALVERDGLRYLQLTNSEGQSFTIWPGSESWIVEALGTLAAAEKIGIVNTAAELGLKVEGVTP